MTSVLLAWLLTAQAYTVPNVSELPLYEYPQVVCPISIDEYLEWYKEWARPEIRKRQLERHENWFKI